MTNVHIGTYLHCKQITYAYLDIPMGHITLHLGPGFTSHPLNCLFIGPHATNPDTNACLAQGYQG
jgi:hypothetical protein